MGRFLLWFRGRNRRTPLEVTGLDTSSSLPHQRQYTISQRLTIAWRYGLIGRYSGERGFPGLLQGLPRRRDKLVAGLSEQSTIPTIEFWRQGSGDYREYYHRSISTTGNDQG